MPYVPIELDAMKKWPMIVQGLGVERATVTQGFCDLWQHVYQESMERREVVDTVGLLHLECMFRAAGERVGAILEAFGFLEATEGGWRVRGARSRIEGMLKKVNAGRAGGLATASSGKSKDNLLASGRRNGKGSKKGSTTEAQKEAPPKQKRNLSSKSQIPNPKSQDSLKLSGEPPAPGWQELVAELHRAFESARGVSPNPKGKDWAALKRLRLRVKNNDTEIVARWARGLRGQFKERVDGFWDLDDRWDALTGTAQAGIKPQEPTKGFAAASAWDGDGGFGDLNKRGAG